MEKGAGLPEGDDGNDKENANTPSRVSQGMHGGSTSKRKAGAMGGDKPNAKKAKTGAVQKPSSGEDEEEDDEDEDADDDG